jgi:hypothetical protein
MTDWHDLPASRWKLADRQPIEFENRYRVPRRDRRGTFSFRALSPQPRFYRVTQSPIVEPIRLSENRLLKNLPAPELLITGWAMFAPARIWSEQ